MRLEGKRALVTGGGRGIGRAIALAFAAEGADVAVAARTESEIESVAADIEGLGKKGFPLKCDVGVPGEIDKVIEETASRLGGIDVLVANAGMMEHASVTEVTDEMWDTALRVNLSSVFWAVRAAAGPMVARGWGRIIAISSVSGKLGGANRSAYHAAKHGVIGFVRSAALEMAEQGVTVNAICPGFVETQMITDALSDFVRYAGNGLDEDETIEMFRQGIPMKRFLDPAEVASMAAYLASDDARGVTGQAFNISCGSVQA
jgi:NAD(P)-dependent dehydrogenase (short-subunit alcohol dehydrogenase family)